MILYHGSYLEIKSPDLDKKEAIRRLRYEKPNLQLCFRTQKALETYLHYEGSEQI